MRHTGALPHSVTCPFSLTETAVPLKLGEEIIGYLRIRQVLRHMPVKSDPTKVKSRACPAWCGIHERYHRGDGIHLWFCGHGHLERIASIIS